MARSPTRITPTLQQLEILWRKYPDIRLGQLIVNIVGGEKNLFYMEDGRLLRRIRAALKKDKG